MNDTTTRQPNRAYPCPNPGPHGRPGCWCPSSSSRCYGDIRGMREDFADAVACIRAAAGPGASEDDVRQDAAELCSIAVARRWSAEEILRRF